MPQYIYYLKPLYAWSFFFLKKIDLHAHVLKTVRKLYVMTKQQQSKDTNPQKSVPWHIKNNVLCKQNFPQYIKHCILYVMTKQHQSNGKKTKSRRSVKSPGILSLYILHIIVYSALHIAQVTSKIISYVNNIYLSHSIFSIALHIANHDKAAIVGKDYLHRKVFFFIPAWKQSSNGRTCCRSLLRHTFSQVSA